MKFSFNHLKNITDFEFLLSSVEEEDLLLALDTAKKKAKHTMSYNQNGEQRDIQTKINNQFQGIIAEIAIEKYLTLLLEPLNDKYHKENIFLKIIRYDAIRTDNFTSPKGEFDLKIICKQNQQLLFEKTIEVRSSKIYDLRKIKEQPIIKKYTNFLKSFEKDNDYFFKAIFNIRNRELSLIDNLKIKNAFAIIGGASLEDFKQNGYKGNLGQVNTTYELLKIKKHNEINNFSYFLINDLNNIIKNYLNLTLENELQFDKNNFRIKI